MTEEQAEDLLWMLDNDKLGDALISHLISVWDRYTNTERGAESIIEMVRERM